MRKVGQVLKRLLQLVLVLFLVTLLLAFLTNLLPADMVDVMLPGQPEEFKVIIRHQLGLDRGFFGYYFTWLGHFLTGNFGSFYFGGGSETVVSHLKKALPISLLLMLYAQIVALAVSIPLGLRSAYRAGGKFDRAVSSALFVAASVPSFAIALVLALVVGVQLGWVEPLGYVPLSQSVVEHFKHMLLPTISLSVGLIAVYTRLLRSDVIATLKEDYVTMAASKGLSDRRILWRHVFRPSCITLMTSAALNMGALIGGTVLIETIFSMQGIGFEIVYALGARQYVALQSLIALVAIFYVLFNAIVDIATGFIDPRTRERRGLR
jgi:peptide/nickel transport system permease protein